MFLLKVIDSDNQEIEVLKTRSQIEMDKFTTFYENEEELLEDLFFDSDSKVIITQTKSNDQEPSVLPFTNVDSRNLVYSFQDENYYSKIVNYDKGILKTFFLNEFLKHSEGNTSFDRTKYKQCKTIVGDFGFENESYFKELLKKDIMAFFDKYYSSFKDFYKFITSFYPEEDYEFSEKDESEHERLISSLRLKIHETHEEKKEYKPYFEEIDSISYNPLADIDDKYTDLDIFLDSKNINEEDKNEIINRQIKKL
ncbi:MAG: hypothetical protein IKF36_02700 [Bacilli bacterium]|nr:hypothetical protein [Bacilli bacterium]